MNLVKMAKLVKLLKLVSRPSETSELSDKSDKVDKSDHSDSPDPEIACFDKVPFNRLSEKQKVAFIGTSGGANKYFQ